MEYVKQLPYIFGTFMGIVIGLISYILGVENNEIYIRVIISIILFYFLGLYIRYYICNMEKDIQEKMQKQDEEPNGETENVNIIDYEENDKTEWTSLHETVKKVGE